MEQYYRLEQVWSEGDFPFEMDLETLDRLNHITPHAYHYMKHICDGEAHIELYEYVGSGVDEE